jgi:choline transport protein
MIWSYLLNGSMGFVMLVTYCFCLIDVEAALSSRSGFPYIYVFQTGTGSIDGAVLGIALVYYFKYARMVYVSPVVYVKDLDR